MNKENSHYLNIANDIISSEFEKRNIQLQNNIEHIADKEAGRGFSIPTGSMIHGIIQTCINELSPRFKFVWETLLKVKEPQSGKAILLSSGINYHSKQQYEFIKEYIGNIKNTYALNSDPQSQSQSVEYGLIELEQEYNRLAKHYQAETQLAEAKQAQQAIKKKSILKRLIGPLLITIIGGLIVGAIIIFVFQPWQQSTQEGQLKQKEAQQSQQPNK